MLSDVKNEYLKYKYFLFKVTGRYLAVGSHENFIDIYNSDTKKRVGICKGASSYITHLEWDVEGKLLMTNSGAKEILYFEMPRGNRVNLRSDDVAKIDWNTFTSVLGSTCEGIWQPCTDVTDINTTCLSHDGQTLATGDDFGMVKLFHYPCLGKFAKFKKYNGHSSHVTLVRWAFDDSKLLSVGGNDTSLMVWKNIATSDATSVIDAKSDVKSERASSNIKSNDLVVRNARKGESEDSETDSEEEGYDSDVKREHTLDYTKNIFVNEIKRPTPAAVLKMYNQVNDSDKM
jgi:microtubule-associated protein-like 6